MSDWMDAALNSKARSEQFAADRDLLRRVEDLERKAKRRPRSTRLDAQGIPVPVGHQSTPGRITFEIRT